jgi:Protein of unknown function (DUF3060)
MAREPWCASIFRPRDAGVAHMYRSCDTAGIGLPQAIRTVDEVNFFMKGVPMFQRSIGLIGLVSLLGVTVLSACGAGAELQSESTRDSTTTVAVPVAADDSATTEVRTTSSAPTTTTQLDVDDSSGKITIDGTGVDVATDGVGVDISTDGVSVDVSTDGTDFTTTVAGADDAHTGSANDDAGTLDGLVFSGDDQTIEADCAGGSATVTGYWNTITLTGSCESVEVSGGDNTITIEAASALTIAGYWNTVDVTTIGSITVDGGDNTVNWVEGLDGGTPKITAADDFNTIVRVR